MYRSFIELDLPLLIDSAFAAGAAMISFGAVLGKTTPAQITWLLAMQVPIYAFNAYLVTEASPSVLQHRILFCACYMPQMHEELLRQAPDVWQPLVRCSCCAAPHPTCMFRACKALFGSMKPLQEDACRYWARRDSESSTIDAFEEVHLGLAALLTIHSL